MLSGEVWFGVAGDGMTPPCLVGLVSLADEDMLGLSRSFMKITMVINKMITHKKTAAQVSLVPEDVGLLLLS